jgi:hypothetical protein
VTPDPFVAFGGGTCVNGGWLNIPPPHDVTVHVSGVVNSTEGGPLEGVLVNSETGGASTVTGADGTYVLAVVVSTTSRDFVGFGLQFSRDGYEPTDEGDFFFQPFVVVPQSQPEAVQGAVLQPVVRVDAGDSLDQSMAFGNSLLLPEPCSPCRIVRVVSQTAGILHLRLTWSDPRAPLSLWTLPNRIFSPDDQGSSETVAEVPIEAGETLVFIGACNDSDFGSCATPFEDETFHLETEMTVASARIDVTAAPVRFAPGTPSASKRRKLVTAWRCVSSRSEPTSSVSRSLSTSCSLGKAEVTRSTRRVRVILEIGMVISPRRGRGVGALRPSDVTLDKSRHRDVTGGCDDVHLFNKKLKEWED